MPAYNFKKRFANLVETGKKKHQSEASLKKMCQEHLQLLENSGELTWDRLNSGKLIQSYTNKAGEEKRYQVKLCREGTADLFFLMNGQMVYLETKKKYGKQREAQIEFEDRVRYHGALYFLIKTFDEFLLTIKAVKRRTTT